MDAYEATRIVFSRIQSLDPENASKIMGFLLIQDHGEKEMIRLAFGPETLLHSLILKAYKELGLSSSSINNNSSNQTTPSSPFPISRQNSSSSSSRLSSNNLLSSSWGFSDFQNYDNPNPPLPPPLPNHELIDEFQLQEQLSFLNEGMGTRNSDLFYPEAAATSPNWATASSNGQHRRSMSVTDICMGSDSMGSGFGWKPCLYYARGYCKNGTSCRFLHGLPDSTDPTPFPLVGSPSNLDVMDQCQELLLRSKTQQQQQRLSTAPQLLPSSSFPYAGSPRMLGEDVHQFGLGRSRIDRNELVNPGSRQIYLTFPADSTFREEDVSNYFSIYGPVQDVRIPYQQKRMFGFVTFVYPETVKLILAKGNPHFVCDARVLVKPYKEKGKVPDKKQQQQQVERGEFSAPTTPNGHDSYDMLLGMQMQSSPRLMYNNHDLILRRKLEEQAELQQAIELQSRRLIGLHLLDANKHQFHRRNLSTGTVPVPSPTHSHTLINQGFVIPTSLPDQTSPAMLEENSARAPIPPAAVTDQNSRQQTEINGGDNCKEETPSRGDCNFHDSVEHNLPDSPFASPTKSGGDASSLIFTSAGESERNISIAADPTSSSTLTSSSTSNNNSVDASLMPATSTIDVTSFKSCFLQIPRLSSGHGAVQM